MEKTIRFRLNGQSQSLTVDEDRTLLWVLRTDLELTGTKYGCGQALCGACTVLIDGEAVRSCNVAVGSVEGSEVTTIEGLSSNGKLHTLQQAFIEHDALQCGYCTPGVLISARALLDRSPSPTDDEIKDALRGNLCRCTGYQRIIDAVLKASRNGGAK